MSKQLQDPHTMPPQDPEESIQSIEVAVVVDGDHYHGYVFEGSWWVHFGGNTVGHQRTPRHEIDGWYEKDDLTVPPLETKDTRWKRSQEAFEERAMEIYEEFLQSMENDPRFTIQLTEEHADTEYAIFMDEGFDRVYTQRGSRLAREMQRRLYGVAFKYFPTHNIEIESHLFKDL